MCNSTLHIFHKVGYNLNMWVCIHEILETICDEKHMASQGFL